MTTAPSTLTIEVSLLEQLAHLSAWEREALFAQLSEAEIAALWHDWPSLARPSQLEPPGDWRLWLILAGRGWGKSRTGAQLVIQRAMLQPVRIALVGETAADVRDVMVEGPSGVVTCSPPWFRPHYEPSKRRVTWSNGSQATTYSGDEPDQLRGPEHHFAWADEPAKWRYLDAAWDNLELGLRLGTAQCVATTTPRPLKRLQEWLADPATHVTRGSTYDNLRNLAPAFRERILKRYEGTRLGRQELHAELLDETPGALWSQALLDACRVVLVPCELVRIVVGIDPAASTMTETGIIVAGLGADGHGYVLDDATLAGTPGQWGKQVVSAYTRWRADRACGEANNGGDMVISTIQVAARDAGTAVATKKLHASRGKYARAEPIAALYEQERIHHVGHFAALETELTNWVPNEGMESPNRFDAAVWALTELLLGASDNWEMV